MQVCARPPLLLLLGLYVPAVRTTAGALELSTSYSPAAALHLDSALEAVGHAEPVETHNEGEAPP